jgi:diguanylate cyclase (GGDEF)-like protein/PAS domain S-box-containing protein
MIALGRPVGEVLSRLAHHLESQDEAFLCAVLLLDRDGKRLRHAAAPGLAKAWRDAIDAIEPGPQAIGCARAAFFAEPALTADIAQDPEWSPLKSLADAHGLRACWAFPLKCEENKVLGVLALYCRETRSPSGAELERIERASHLACVLLQGREAGESFRQSEARFHGLLQLTSDWYWEQDEQFRFTKMSHGQLSRNGALKPDDHIGKTRWELPSVGMTEADWVAHRATLELHQPFYEFIVCRPGRDGEPCYSSISGEPMFDAQGRFMGYRGIGKDITARKRAEEALRHSEERFRNLTDLSSDWYWEQDERYEFVSATGKRTANSYAKFEYAVGKTRWDLGHEIISGGDWSDHIAVLETRLPFHDLELRCIGPDGNEFFISASGRPVFDEQGSFKGYQGIGRDITARVRAHKLLQLEHTVARRLAEAESESDGVRAVMKAVCESQAWDCGRYWKIGEAARVLKLSDYWAAPGLDFTRFIDDTRELDLTPGRGLVGKVWESEQAMWSPNVGNDPRALGLGMSQRHGVRGSLVFPVMAEGRIIGMVSIVSQRVRQADERLLQTVNVIGSQLGQFVQRKRAEEILRESEERFRSLTALSTDWYWEQGEDFRFTVISDNFLRTIRRPREAVLGKTRWELGALNMSEADWTMHQALLRAHQPFYELELLREVEGREPRYTTVSGVPIFDTDGRFVGYRGIGRDITERKRDEEALRRFRASMDMSGELIFLVDRESMRFIDANETACRALGYTREELLSMGPHQIVPSTREKFERSYDNMIATGTPQSGMRSRYRRKDGGLIPFEASRRVMRSGDRWIIVVISRDTTERITAEEAVRLSNERFNLAVRATNDVIYDWDLVQDQLWWNENVTAVFGYGRDSLDGTGKFWYDGIHPEDRERIVKGIHGVIESGGENWNDEYRFRRQDGTYAHILDRGHLIHGDSGRAVRMIGAMADITVRKQAEEKVRNQALQQRLIAQFGHQALASVDLPSVLNHAVNLVRETLKVDFCAVLELSPEGDHGIYRAGAGFPEERVGTQTPPFRPGSRIAHVLATREPVMVEDYATELRFPPSPMEKLGVRSGIQLPIPGGSGIFGLLGAHACSPRRFSRDDASFLQSIANILAVAIERKNAEDRLAHLAQFDSLTGLPNRYLFHDRLLQSVAQAKRSAKVMAVLFIDLDRFKLVNDTLGHRAGDQLLREAALRLAQNVRSGDTVGRFGGDEFGAILSDLGKPSDASVVAQKVIESLAQPFHLDGQETFISASVGITIFPSDGDNPEALIMNADTAMYRAKDQGRNSYQFYTREMNERALKRVQTEASLRRALDRGEFLLHYQPRLALASGTITGFEALLRWRHPERGIVLPSEFIPVLEDTGLIVPVGEWVMREVCRQLNAWSRAGIVNLPVAINLSARQFQQRNLERTVCRILEEASIPPSLVQFELTESLLMKDPEAAARTLQRLKELGVTVSVDDFGTGYSSLAYLKRFPIDALKIDQAFVRDITVNQDDAVITLAIIGLAHSLGLKVVAEGVETREQADMLARHGCDEIQGYFLAAPADASVCERMLRKVA